MLRSGHKTESEAEAPEKDKEEESALDPSDLRSSEERVGSPPPGALASSDGPSTFDKKGIIATMINVYLNID